MGRQPKARRRTDRGWMCFLHSGPMNLEDLGPEDIDLRDIAAPLALINRFTGQSRRAIPVLWHCRMVRQLTAGNGRAVELEALMHDAEEAYIGDWIRPLKHRMSNGLIEMKERIHQVCYDAAGIMPGTTPTVEVKEADSLMVRYELGSPWGLGASTWWEGKLEAEEAARVHLAQQQAGDPPQNEDERTEQIRLYAAEIAELLEPWATLAKSAAALVESTRRKQ